MKQIVLLALFICTVISSFGQRNKKAQAESPSISIDTLINPIPNTRSLFHVKIDDALSDIDHIDGKYDGKIENYRSKEISEIIHNQIFRKGKQLSIFIENQVLSTDNFTNNQLKIKYLRKLEDNLKSFYEDNYDGDADPKDYALMLQIFEQYIIAAKEKKINEFVRNNANMGLYLNRGLIEDDKEAMNLLIDSMCYKYPQVMESKMKEVADYPGAATIMSHIARRNYLDVYKYAMTSGPERKIVMNSKDPLVIKLRELIYGTKAPLKALAFFKDYESGKKTLAEIDKMTENPDAYFKSLVAKQIEIGDAPNYILRRDLKEEALRYVREINDLHDEKPEVRFKILENLTAQELYYLNVLCNSEIYTSSFTKGTYAKLLERMKPQGGDEFLHSIGMDRFRTFIRMCANYNTLDSFLATMKVDKRNMILKEFVTGLGDKNEIDLEGAVDVADCFGSINDPGLLKFLQEEVRNEYEKNYLNNKKDGLIVYFILHTLFSSKQENFDDSLFNGTLTKSLGMKPINKMPFQWLIDSQKRTVYEQVVFYGDKDGKDSYANFLNYINKTGLYNIDESNPYFIRIKTKNSKIPIEIFANRPLDEEGDKDTEAQKKLNDYLLKSDISPSILIHRGHSYHLPGTIEMMNEHNKIIILGSCGSYHNLSKILDRSADAQMVSSKQVGTMQVNDPIITEVNTSVMNGNDVNWVNIWKKLDASFTTPAARDLFNDYVPPHKNLGALFIKAYQTIREKSL